MSEDANLPLSPNQITLAFSYSKIQFVQELEEVEKYKRMQFVEFLEFIGRMADLAWTENEDEPFETKLWRTLGYILKGIGEQVKSPVIEDLVDSESDYEDTIADEYLK